MRCAMTAALLLTSAVAATSSSNLFAATSHAPGTHEEGAIAFRAEHVHLADGSILENGVVLIEGDKITEVGKGVSVPKDVLLIELEGHLSAGLVVVGDQSSIRGESRDSTRTVTPEADLLHAFRPDHADMQRLLSEGITSALLAPTGGNLVGGLCAVVKPKGSVLARRSHLAVDMSSRAITSNRFPTSYQGIYQELEARFAEAQGRFGEAVRGELPVLLNAATRSETQRALAFARRHKLKGVLSGATRLEGLADEVKAAGVGVVLPASMATRSRHLVESSLALARLEVPFAFSLGAPAQHPVTLRLAAARCVNGGLDSKVALAALTSTAASLAGVGDRVGTLQAGRDADFVLWSGPPTDLRSRVLKVYVNGALVFEGKHDSEEEEDDQ